ncbi:iron regulated [Trifolium repens]|nr:iron regulated [Trifolium repens]
MTAILEWEGIPEYVIGIARGISAVIGIAATVVYPMLQHHISDFMDLNVSRLIYYLEMRSTCDDACHPIYILDLLYVEVNMDFAALVWPFETLAWPSVKVNYNKYLCKALAGDINPAIRTDDAFLSVWKRYGFTPECFNLASLTVQVPTSLSSGPMKVLVIVIAVFEQVTKNAVLALWARRSKLNLVGAHINVFTCEWTQKDAGIGTSIDSFYEYLLKVSSWSLV